VSDPASAAAPAAVRGATPAGFTGTDALLVFMVVVWGVNFIIIKAAMRDFDPLAFNAVRFTLAAGLVATAAFVTGTARPSRDDLRRLALLGLLGNTLYQIGFIEGVARTRAGNAALIMAAVPVQTAIISHLRGHDRLRLRDVLGLLVSTAGIATIVLGSGKAVEFGATVSGDLMVLAATVCWSVYTVGSKPIVDRTGPLAATAWTMGCGAVPLGLVSIPSLVRQDWRAPTGAAWAGIAFSAMGALGIAYVIWYRGVQKLGAARTALYSNFTPVVAMLAAWALIGETPTAWQVTGAGGIFGGIWLTRT